MIFINNKYTHWYYQIINAAQLRPKPNCYVERHHIIPESLGGPNISDNLVYLTAREHYVCHLLLTKMVSGKQDKMKMYFAIWKMMNCENPKQKRYLSFSSSQYEMIRKHRSKFMSQPFEKRYGKKRAAEIRKKQSINHRGYNSDETRKKISESVKARNMRWFNNGSEEVFVQAMDTIPEGKKVSDK